MSKGSEPPSTPDDRRWRGSQPSAPANGSSRWLLVTVLGVFFTVLVAILVSLYFITDHVQATSIVSIPVREYTDAGYSVNPFAEQDSAAITGCFAG